MIVELFVGLIWLGGMITLSERVENNKKKSIYSFLLVCFWPILLGIEIGKKI